MLNLFSKTLCIFLIAFSIVLSAASSTLAGGGQYQPIGFSWGQVINGKSVNVEFAVQRDDFSGFAVGEDFELIAHNDLPGASCQTTQRTSDAQGRVKGTCKADATGRFVFEIQPVSRRSVTAGATFEVNFSSQATSTGFVEQGSKSTEGIEAVIIQTPGTIKPDQTFVIEVKAKKNGQIIDDSSSIQLVKWIVLKGSLVTLSEAGGSSGNRRLNVSTTARGTVVAADVTLASGEQIKAPGKTIVFAALPSPISSPTVKPSPIAGTALEKQPVTQSQTVVDSAQPATASAEPASTPIEEPQAEPKLPWWKKVWKWIAFWKS